MSNRRTPNPAKRASIQPVASSFETELAALAPSSTKRAKTDPDDETGNKRPPLTPNPACIVQVLDVETYYVPGTSASTCDRTNVKLYGVTKEGWSACIIVTDYFPHFFIQAPKDFRAEHLGFAKRSLCAAVGPQLKRAGANASQASEDTLFHISIVQAENIYFYRGENAKANFLKITGTTQSLQKARNALKDGVNLMGTGSIPTTTFYEANIDPEVKFMVETGIVGCGWVEAPTGKFKEACPRSSRCQLEIEVPVHDLKVHGCEGEWAKVAPLRTLSFDIECAGRRGIFPEPQMDPVIQIANMIKDGSETEPSIRVVFVLKTCAPIVGCEVVQCQTEEQLLNEWAEFVRRTDPDILTGYNILNFDLPYILERAKVLKVPKVAELGRQCGRPSSVRDAALSSRQLGSRVNKAIDIHGRVIFDVLQVVQRDYKLRSYTLNSVSYHFLAEQKEDVEHSAIPDLHNGDEQTRRRLAIYCIKDAALPLRLLDKLMSVINYMEMSRVTGVPLNYLLSRGQQIKILSMILRRCRSDGFVVPVIEQQGNEETTYEGATVIDPIRGFYNEPIATLDFASLYPSIMIAHNLCYTTLLPAGSVPGGMQEGADYEKTPVGHSFVTPKVRRGLLPSVLEDLLAARKRVKNELKKETDVFKQMVLNGRQLALKVSANSVYGFTGATIGKLPCLEISGSVTAYGRTMIELTKSTVERTYKKGALDGLCTQDAQVVYGDTDSVMVKFGVQTVAEAMKIGQQASVEVSRIFRAPIKLEFEKVYFPYLLINKKRYAGLYFTKPDKHDKMDCKGLETVRRDNCPLVAQLLSRCLELLLVERDKDAALAHARSTISDLLCNRIDISALIISKELTRQGDKYQAKQAHVELANRMRKRDPGSAPRLGDRVPYVIVAGAKNAAAYEKAEDPTFVLQNNIPIDTNYYLTNQLAKPLARIFEPILGDKAEKVLTQGEHTRTRTVVQSKVGGLSSFTKRSATCLGCKSVLKPGRANLATCEHCAPKEGAIYLSRVAEMNALESRFGRLWTECQNCACTLHEKINCSARDCPIYYAREKVRSDLKEAYDVVQRFGEPCW